MFDNEIERRHIQRVAGWLCWLVRAIELQKDEWHFLHTKQLAYRIGPAWFKVRYSHSVDNGSGFNRGGIEIVKMKGHSDGPVVHTISNIKRTRRVLPEQPHISGWPTIKENCKLERSEGNQHKASPYIDANPANSESVRCPPRASVRHFCGHRDARSARLASVMRGEYPNGLALC
jgi:hypothetical protein